MAMVIVVVLIVWRQKTVLVVTVVCIVPMVA